ncbi:MAG TPA: hypothetical protein ENN80_11885, partial [Candidatus Hydrogenedentes bacterium]|nr:hypothetical protein [Candidatus Hydrogenedentota bacterium]
MAASQASSKGPAGNALARLSMRTAILTFVAGVVAAGYSLTLENEYRANAGLALQPTPLNQPELRGLNINPDVVPVPGISFLMVKPLSVPVYESLLMNGEIVATLCEKLESLSRTSDDEAPTVLREDVRRAMDVKTRVLSRTAREVEYDPIIQLLFTHTDPTIAAEMVNEWAQLAIEMGAKVSRQSKEGSLQFLEQQFLETTEELEDKERELEALRSEWDTRGLEQRLGEMQLKITQYELDEVQLENDIARTQGELAEIETDLE